MVEIFFLAISPRAIAAASAGWTLGVANLDFSTDWGFFLTAAAFLRFRFIVGWAWRNEFRLVPARTRFSRD